MCFSIILTTCGKKRKNHLIQTAHRNYNQGVHAKGVHAKGVHAKNLQETILFVEFSKAFDSIHREKMEQIFLVYGFPKGTVAAIMMLYKNTKVKVCSSDGDIDYFDIVAGVLQGDTLAPYLFIICLDYMLRTSIDLMKENGFKLAKKEAEDTKHKQLRMWTMPMT